MPLAESVDRGVVVVTGPARSGTSCVTAMLAACGLGLGTKVDVDLAPSPHNPLGHFESTVLLNINRRILQCAQGRGSMLRVPEAGRVAEAALQHLCYMDLFIRHFDGRLVKDPVFCLTLPLWEEAWPAIAQVVYCLRHPLAVAESVVRRYPKISRDDAVRLWYVYTHRLLDLPRRSPVVIFDFDAFSAAPRDGLAGLLEALGIKAVRPLAEVIAACFLPEHVHHRSSGELPATVAALFQMLKGTTRLAPTCT